MEIEYNNKKIKFNKYTVENDWVYIVFGNEDTVVIPKDYFYDNMVN